MLRPRWWRDILRDVEHDRTDQARVPSPLWYWRRATELPEQVEAHTLYVIGQGNHRWSAALQCPCGCGAIVHVSLAKERRPRWEVVQHRDGTVTLYPSVRRITGCRSHFIVAEGRLFFL